MIRSCAFVVLVLSLGLSAPAQDSAKQPPAQPGSASRAGAEPAAQPSPADLEAAVKRTDAMRLLSEAEQAADENREQEALDKFQLLGSTYRTYLDGNTLNQVMSRVAELRNKLNLPALAPGQLPPVPGSSWEPPKRTGDEEIDGITMLLTGSFATRGPASETSPLMQWNSAQVKVDGLLPAIYFELSRVDDPANPFRQGIITLLRVEGTLRLRVMDIAIPTLRQAVVGFWAAPEAFPQINVDALLPNLELVVTRAEDGSQYSAVTPAPVATYRGGAVQMTSQMLISADGITAIDRGLDAAGKQVWGPASTNGLVFTHIEPTIKAERRDGGLIVIDLVKGAAANGSSDNTALVQGGEVAFHFTYWLADGTQLDSSRARTPARVTYPTGFMMGIDNGLDKLTKGTRRRVYIPPALGFGPQARGNIPANSTIIFDVEALWVAPPAQPPAIEPLPSEPAPAGPEPAPSAPAPAPAGATPKP